MELRDFLKNTSLFTGLIFTGNTASLPANTSSSKNSETGKYVLGHNITPYSDISGDFDMVLRETQPNGPGPPPN